MRAAGSGIMDAAAADSQFIDQRKCVRSTPEGGKEQSTQQAKDSQQGSRLPVMHPSASQNFPVQLDAPSGIMRFSALVERSDQLEGTPQAIPTHLGAIGRLRGSLVSPFHFGHFPFSLFAFSCFDC